MLVGLPWAQHWAKHVISVKHSQSSRGWPNSPHFTDEKPKFRAVHRLLEVTGSKLESLGLNQAPVHVRAHYQGVNCWGSQKKEGAAKSKWMTWLGREGCLAQMTPEPNFHAPAGLGTMKGERSSKQRDPEQRDVHGELQVVRYRWSRSGKLGDKNRAERGWQ